ncbi:zinc finger protein 429-like isoform X2 [Salarias fasciatus]|uniref:zinc finger protein 429-like isoform X2 n=1 Tax=Salarias fasciatus TaxID=181472 RepID=UPI0011766032|nr:zinc finger protein 429-like isoform X2 [Salarias fasciatus]
MESLKEFISQRLHAAAAEILGAVVKNVSDLEEQTVRLKEENQRLRSLLDIIVKSTEAREPKIIRRPDETSRRPAPHKQAKVLPTCGPLKPKSKCLFASREDLLKVQDANGNCPYCIKKLAANEAHLLNRHYSRAIHFISGGTEKFVIPCMCKDKIQGRSHWHCPCCQKIIYRTCNFEAHLSKMHGYATQHQHKDGGQFTNTSQPSAPETEANHEPIDQQQLEQLEQHTMLMLQVKQESNQATDPQVQVAGEQFQNADSQTGGQSLEMDFSEVSANSVVFVDSFIQDLSEITSLHNYTKCGQPTVTDAECQTSASVKCQDPPGKRGVAETVCNSQTEGSTQLPSNHNPTGSHSCKVCGKLFSHLYSLKAHAQNHAMDNKPTCGVCGKCPKPAESLTQHLLSHSKRNKCVRCRKEFSSSSRLKRHMMFHRAKVSNASGKDLQV